MALTERQEGLAKIIVMMFRSHVAENRPGHADFNTFTPEQQAWMLSKIEAAAYRDPDKWGQYSASDLYQRVSGAAQIMGPKPLDKHAQPVDKPAQPVQAVDHSNWGEW